jgi:RNA-binding protein
MPSMAELTSKQRQFLKGLAHALAPVVRVGKAGLTDAVVAETKTALRAHELIKARLEVDTDAREDTAEQLAAGADAELVATVGKMAILYRGRDGDPGIELPR